MVVEEPMPTYEYRCEGCDRTFEIVQSFTDEPLTTCEACTGHLRKVYAPVGIVFKGSGFYKTDSRQRSKPASRTASEGSASTESSSETKTGEAAAATSGTETKSDSTPAPAAPAPAAASTASSAPAAAKGS
jgi:putative FmdB family regulatory protein